MGQFNLVFFYTVVMIGGVAPGVTVKSAKLSLFNSFVS